MGQTVAQKIIARAAGLASVTPGEYVTVEPDYTVMQELFWLMNLRHMADIGIDRMINPDKVIAVVDHTTQAAMGSPYHEAHADMKAYADRTGFKNMFGAGRGGLRHQVMVERGFARPGLLVFSDEPNIASIGAVGALNVPVSWEVLVTMVKPDNWLRVPESVKVRLDGRFGFGVLVRDLVQAINRDFAATDALLQKCVEYDGPALVNMSLDARQSLLASTYHAGAETAIMPVDSLALDYVDTRAAGRPYEVLESDPDALYDFERTYDLSILEPFVSVPPTQDQVVPVNELRGQRVNQAAIGSCASNRLEDLRAAAEVLKSREIHQRVTMYVSPGSPEIFSAAAAEGILQIFSDAGAAVLSPGCNTCWGYLGVLNAGEVSISTHQELYHGRNGSRDAEVYLASPYVVAASAIAGEIVDPRRVLAEKRVVR